MRKTTIILLAVSVAFMFACGTEQVKKQDVSDPNVAIVSTSNEQLAKIPVTGFDYKSSKVPAQKWDLWAKASAPVVKGIIDKLPEGYVLQVTGHADARGPEEPTGNKPGNIKISTDRAAAVYNALKRQGISSPKMTYKGVGSSELLEGVDPKDPKQRRVSFKVLPKQ